MVKLIQLSVKEDLKVTNVAKEGSTALYVDGKDGLDTYSGDSWEEPFKTIGHAIDEADSWCKIYVKSKPYSSMGANAASGQKDVTVDDGALFSVGDSVIIREDDYTERATIDAISGNVLTMVSNLSNAYTTADNGIVICTYNENVHMNKDGIRLIGEDEETTIVAPATDNAIYTSSVPSVKVNNCIVDHIGAVVSQTMKCAVLLHGSDNICQNTIVDSTGAANAYGCGLSGGGRATANNVRNATSGLVIGVYALADDNEVFGCDIRGLVYGIWLQTANRNKVHNNNISDCTTFGLNCASSTLDNSIYHNNFDSNVAQINTSVAPANNEWFENFYSNHVTDANNDGMADTVYTENGITDYQPVSRRNGWKQESLPTITSGAGVAGIGVTQVKTISVTAAANAASDTTLGTVTTNGCIIQGVVIHADRQQTAVLTSCPVHGGAAKVLEFISAANATQANLNATNKQVGWDGEVYLPTGSTIVMVHNGSGAALLELTVTIRYIAVANGGYLA